MEIARLSRISGMQVMIKNINSTSRNTGCANFRSRKWMGEGSGSLTVEDWEFETGSGCGKMVHYANFLFPKFFCEYLRL